jgi:hypothetical protein
MRTGLKVLTAVLALVGAGMLVLMIVGIFQWILIGAVILGIAYAAVKFATGRRKSIGPGDVDLHRKLKSLENDLKDQKLR